MNTIENFFGTDGIRGPYGVFPLDDNGILQMGRAIGTHFGKQATSKTVILGRDTRESSPKITKLLSHGLQEAGLDVLDTGVIPTAGLAYLTGKHDVACGIMITASHNVYTDNGIKIFKANGGKLNDSEQQTISQLITSDIAQKLTRGSYNDQDMTQEYVDFLLATLHGAQLNGLQLAVDCANGATSAVAERVFTLAGANVTILFNEPNGRNINAACGSTDTAQLRAFVLENHLDAGIAFDGDGDRVIIIDHLGRELDGDHLLYILASCIDIKTVVATVMSNLGLENALAKKGIKLERTSVGDHNVLVELQNKGLSLGGEQNGHLILNDYLPTSDGLLAGLQTLCCVEKSGEPLSKWRDKVALVPQALVNIPMNDRLLLEKTDVTDYIALETQKLGDQGRILIRPSGTEPMLRVMVEADDATAKATEIAKHLEQLLEASTGSLSLPLSGFDDLVTEIRTGRDENLEKLLIIKSREPHILEHTPKDASGRFKDQTTLDKWISDSREVHWLIGKNADLAGIIWYREQPIPDSNEMPAETFAVRIYSGYQGKGLARPFMTQSLRIHNQQKRDNGKPLSTLWLETDSDNVAALKAYEKFGYQKIRETDGRVLMTLEPELQASL